MAEERLYIVAYDIADRKRWRRVFKTCQGYGTWLQLSIFQCRLTARRRADLAARLEALIHHDEDHVMLMDMGPAETVDPKVESLGKTFTAQKREVIII
ncbi:CRISPR-associated endonuclease Cas2 [Yunchengibacter salinarum]|uniref:CRISPR-associated endonuclease Cas2 n=1 Tax=Yunchengibacter salinarum TaxID=3133399 RepID=UPI0035B690C6